MYEDLNIEKSLSHKYFKKEPDGKGGFKYYYTEQEYKDSKKDKKSFNEFYNEISKITNQEDLDKYFINNKNSFNDYSKSEQQTLEYTKETMQFRFKKTNKPDVKKEKESKKIIPIKEDYREENAFKGELKKDKIISKETIDKLKDSGYLFYFHDEDFNDVPLSQATHIYVNGKSIKIPKNKYLSFDDIVERSSGKKTKEFLDNMNSIVKKMDVDKTGVNVFGTTYGIGISTLFGKPKSIETIKNILDNKGIKYTEQKSDANWVHRFKISQTTENLNRLKTI